MLALEKRISAECLQLTQQDLAKYQGHEFDMAFIGTQIAMHNGMLAKLKGSEEFASGEFQALLQKGAQTTMHHKQMAEQIQSQVAAAGGANQPGDAARTPARPGAQPAAPTPGGAANPPRSR
jgi:hypothetical protein